MAHDEVAPRRRAPASRRWRGPALLTCGVLAGVVASAALRGERSAVPPRSDDDDVAVFQPHRGRPPRAESVSPERPMPERRHAEELPGVAAGGHVEPAPASCSLAVVSWTGDGWGLRTAGGRTLATASMVVVVADGGPAQFLSNGSDGDGTPELVAGCAGLSVTDAQAHVPACDTHVVGVDAAGTRFELGVGAADEVAVGREFVVHREGEFVAAVVVESVEAAHCIAVAREGMRRETPHVGDQASTQLRGGSARRPDLRPAPVGVAQEAGPPPRRRSARS